MKLYKIIINNFDFKKSDNDNNKRNLQFLYL